MLQFGKTPTLSSCGEIEDDAAFYGGFSGAPGPAGSGRRSAQGELRFLQGGGEMGQRIRDLDWSKTPLGPPETWPQNLRSAVSMLLPSKAQIIFFWGPQFITLYNDNYRSVFAGKHPRVLGLPGWEAWDELWNVGLKDLLEGVVATGEAFWASDRLFVVERAGYREETYFDVSYDPSRMGQRHRS